MITKHERQEAAATVRRLLAAVECGGIDADSPAARRLIRRLEGAAAAWEVEAHDARTGRLKGNDEAGPGGQ